MNFLWSKASSGSDSSPTVLAITVIIAHERASKYLFNLREAFRALLTFFGIGGLVEGNLVPVAGDEESRAAISG